MNSNKFMEKVREVLYEYDCKLPADEAASRVAAYSHLWVSNKDMLPCGSCGKCLDCLKEERGYAMFR